MKRRIVFILVPVLTVVVARELSRVPEALSRVEAFRITELRLEGNRFLTREEAAKTAAISTMASIWDDFGVVEERLRLHPLVEEVRAKRRFPGTLLLEVVEVQPVALVPTPTLEPVDASGQLLPIDPAEHQLDLPIIGVRKNPADDGLSAAERRLVAGEIASLAQGHPGLLAQISEVVLDGRGDLWAQLWGRESTGDLWEMPVTLRFHPSLSTRRLQEGLRVLGDAIGRFEGAVVADLASSEQHR